MRDWSADVNRLENEMHTVAGLVYALEKVIDENAVFDQPDRNSPEVVSRDANAIHSSIRQLTKFMRELEEAETERNKARRDDRS